MSVRYTAVVLTEESRNQLLEHFKTPASWEVVAHHLTINMGNAEKGPAAELLGQEATLVVVGIAQDEKVMALQVETSVPSINAIKHVTVAVNRGNGGKPFDSNKLINWNPVDKFVLKGVVQEV